jgi:hypothetical protein
MNSNWSLAVGTGRVGIALKAGEDLVLRWAR